MTGGGYTAVRIGPELPEDSTIESATLEGCTDVVFFGGTVVGRGEATAGARLTILLSEGEWSTTIAAPVTSTLTPRVYGEIAVRRMEPFAEQGEGVPEAFARHFRVVRATCSLVMLESEKDYERFGIRAKDDAAVVERVQVAPWLKGRRIASPKQLLGWRLKTLGKSTALLKQVPDAEFEDLPLARTTDAALAATCDKLKRPRLGLVYDALSGNTRRESLCLQILMTDRGGFWFDHARKTLGGSERAILVLMQWDTENSDVDLHVVDPTGDVCNWRRPLSSLGGKLAGDREHGSRPEVFRIPIPLPGEYVVRVNYFKPNGPTRASIIAIANGKVFRASVVLTRRHEMVEALRVTIPKVP